LQGKLFLQGTKEMYLAFIWHRMMALNGLNKEYVPDFFGKKLVLFTAQKLSNPYFTYYLPTGCPKVSWSNLKPKKL
jgi:hypothetical protein